MQEDNVKLRLPPPSISFSLLNAFSLSIVYAKIEAELYIRWWVALAPSCLYLLI